MISRSDEQFVRNFRDTHSYRRRFACHRISRKAGHILFAQRARVFTHVVLFANKDKLSRRGIVVVLQKVMHAEPKIVQIELAEVFAVTCKGRSRNSSRLRPYLRRSLYFPQRKPAASRTSEAMIDAITLTVTSPLSPLIICVQKVERA